MADGDMKRWYKECDVPKHLMHVGSETLLERLVRQLHSAEPGSEVIITSHNEKYEVPGAVRYEPKDNHIEIDRFTWELIEDDVCFLYGDTFYTDEAIELICNFTPREIQFVGTATSIVAVIVHDSDLMRKYVRQVKDLYLDGKIGDCRGWQVYQAYEDLPFGSPVIGPSYALITDETCGFNTWLEYKAFIERNTEFKWMRSNWFEKLPKN